MIFVALRARKSDAQIANTLGVSGLTLDIVVVDLYKVYVMLIHEMHSTLSTRTARDIL